MDVEHDSYACGLFCLPGNVLLQVVSHLDGPSRKCLRMASRNAELQDLVNNSFTTLQVPSGKLPDGFCRTLRALFPKVRHFNVQVNSFHLIRTAFIYSAPLWPLQTLHLSATFLTGGEMHAIVAACPHLTALKLSGLKDPNLGILRQPIGLELSSLVALRELKQLQLDWQPDYSQALHWLASMHGLDSLEVKCFDRQLVPVTALSSLTHLRLSICSVDRLPIDLSPLSALEELSLTVLGEKEPADMRCLTALTRLRRLSLCGTDLPAGLMADLACRLPCLQHLTLRQVEIPAEELPEFAFPALQHLTMADVNGHEVVLARPMPRLQTLLLGQTPSEASVGQYKGLAQQTAIQRLMLPVSSEEDLFKQLVGSLLGLGRLRQVCLYGEPTPPQMLLLKAALDVQLPGSCLHVPFKARDMAMAMSDMQAIASDFWGLDVFV